MPTFFSTPAELRRWFDRNHASARELWIGFYKLDSGRGGIRYLEALDEALAVGWIDGVKKRVDDISYAMRFTPRRPKSRWSAVNIHRMKQLIAEKRVRPSGLAAFESRDEAKAKSDYEQRRSSELDPASEKRFRANRKAWAFFSALPPGYRKTLIFWIMSAKKDETRRKRLAEAIEVFARGERIDFMTHRSRSKT